jgi:transmembrane sensor
MEQSSNIPEDIGLLITDLFNRSIDEEGMLSLTRWISEKYENEKLFHQIRSTWLMSGKKISVNNKQTLVALSKVKNAIDSSQNKSLKPFWTISRIAASWLLFLALGGIIGSLTIREHSQYNELQNNTIVTAPLGARSIMDLPDGTKVWLNAGSKISYNNSYGKNKREVWLTGEAFFSVKTNKKIPFLVNASDVIVKAMGTRFNVKAYPDEKVITTTLEEGKVLVTSVHSPSDREVAELKPHQMVTFHKEKTRQTCSSKEQSQTSSPEAQISITREGNMVELMPIAHTERLTSWKDETWIIEGETLGSLLPMLERRFNVKIFFDSADIAQFKFTGRFQKESMEQILVSLKILAPINYTIDHENIHISLNKNSLEQYKKNISH